MREGDPPPGQLLGVHQPEPRGGVERRQRLAGIAAAGGDQDPHRPAIAQHRRGLEDFAFAERQARQAPLQRVTDRGGSGRDRGTDRGRAAAGDDVAPDLPKEEGVAAGLITQHGGVLARPAHRKTALGHQVLSDLVGAEPGQVDAADAIEPVQVSDRVGQLVGTVGSRRAVGAQQQQPGLRGVLRHVAEQLQGRRACPVQVLQDAHHRADLADRSQQVGDRVRTAPGGSCCRRPAGAAGPGGAAVPAASAAVAHAPSRAGTRPGHRRRSRPAAAPGTRRRARIQGRAPGSRYRSAPPLPGDAERRLAPRPAGICPPPVRRR